MENKKVKEILDNKSVKEILDRDLVSEMSIKEILEYDFLNIGDFHLSLLHLLLIGLIFMIARVFISFIGRILKRYFRRKKVDTGRQFAVLQFVKYAIFTKATLVALETVGISISVLWGGAAALLVGIGFALQQTFTDIISGIILLIEGTIEVGDVIEVEGLVGSVTDIGIRTSKIETRDRITIIIPNTKLISENTTNWSHDEAPARFQINVGVAYHSDIDLVTSLLLEAASEHSSVLKSPLSRVQLKNFGDSSLDFVLYFFSYDYLSIEFVKSELRYKITKLFREKNVEIPFPQRDLWLRNPGQLDEELLGSTNNKFT